MEYVYLVYDECCLEGAYRSEAEATKRVLDIATNEQEIDTESTPLDFNNDDEFGWYDCNWSRVELKG